MLHLKRNNTKYYIFILFIVSIIIVFFNVEYQLEDNSIQGSWVGEYNNKEIELKFNEDQTCKVQIKNIIFGDVTTLDGNYNIDYTPAQ